MGKTSLFHHLLQQRHQFVHHVLVALTDAVGHAGADVAAEQLLAEAVEGGGDGGHLHQNVGAVGVALQHVLQTAHLSFDTTQTVYKILIFFF